MTAHDFNLILLNVNREFYGLIPVVLFVLAGIVGSFMGCALYRVPRNESLSYPSSNCPNCNKILKVWDLIPIFSYLFNKTKCRYCGIKVSSRYIIIELISVMLAVVGYYYWGVQLKLFIGVLLLWNLQFSALYWYWQRAITHKVLLFSIILIFVLHNIY